MAGKRTLTVDEARERRVAINKELGELLKQLQEWYTEYVKPAAVEAKLSTTGGSVIGARGASTKVLPLDIADMLDVSTPQGRFEKGRAHMAALDARIQSLRREHEKLAKIVSLPRPIEANQLTITDRLLQRVNANLGQGRSN